MYVVKRLVTFKIRKPNTVKSQDAIPNAQVISFSKVVSDQERAQADSDTSP